MPTLIEPALPAHWQQDWPDALADIARQAGEVILRIYETDFDVQGKSDQSPVTAADEAAETLILAALRQLAPGLPIVAEESVAAGRIPLVGRRFWLVDPLDGTREFIKRNGEFTVNIALIEDGAPILGAVLAPATGSLFVGAAGLGAWREEAGRRSAIQCRVAPPEGLTVVASRSHDDPAAIDEVLAGRSVARRIQVGSSLKLCLIAAGQADFYPRLGRTMEWDIAAGHAVLVAAGGRVTDVDGVTLRYGKPGFENPRFVAQGRLS